MQATLAVIGVLVLAIIIYLVWQQKQTKVQVPPVIVSPPRTFTPPVPEVLPLSTAGRYATPIYGCRSGIRYLYTPGTATLWTRVLGPCFKGDKQI